MKTGTFSGGTLPAHPGPAGGDGRRSCVTCGAPQDAEARYCWRCLSRDANAIHTHPPTTAPTTPRHRIRFEIAPAAPPRGLGRVRDRVPQQVIVGLGILVLLGVLLRGAPYDVPETIGTAARLSSPAHQATASAWADSLVDSGIEGDVAIFGRNDTASFALVAYGGRPGSDREALVQLSDGWGAVSGSTVRTSSVEVTERAGFTFACAPVSGGGFRSMCAWADAEGFVGGIVAMDAGRAETLELAAAARRAMA